MTYHVRRSASDQKRTSRLLPAVAACLCLAVGLPPVALAQPSSRDHNAASAKKKAKKKPRRKSRGARGVKGDKGDRGASGAKGDSGLAGTNGTNGTNGTDGKDGTNGATEVTVHANSGLVGPGGSSYVKASCPAGQTATGGGGSWTDGSQFLSRSIPSTATDFFAPEGETPTAWTVFGVNNGGATATLVAYVVCAAP
jgi:hypothetical protein